MAEWGAPFPGEGWKEHMCSWHFWRNGQSVCGKYSLRIAGRVRPGRELKLQPPTGERVCEGCAPPHERRDGR
jgi:hypothetical protein